jgi:hypothetical protein
VSPVSPSPTIKRHCRCVALPLCIAIAGWLGLWPSRAGATCGDYLLGGHGRFASPAAMDQHFLKFLEQAGSPLEPAPGPCHGPHCSQDRHPLPLAPVQANGAPQDWACLCSAEFANRRAAPRPSGETPLYPRRFSSRPFRPPR